MSLSAVLISRLRQLQGRYEELAALLAGSSISPDQLREFGQEYAKLEPIVSAFAEFVSLESQLEEANAMIAGDDREMAELAKEELAPLQNAISEAEQSLKVMLLPEDPDDQRNIFLEVRRNWGR